MPDPRVRAHRWRCVTCTQEMSTDNPTGPLLEASVRAVYTEGMERVADLTTGPYELEVIHGARHLRVRFRLEEP